VKDGAKSPQDRRAEIFFFDEGIKPPPPGPTSKKGSKEYPQWVAGVSDTVELAFSDLTDGFDFDLPKQKEEIPAPEPLAGAPGGGPDEPILVAANDDAVVANIIEEARLHHENRGKDNTFTSDTKAYARFKIVEKAERPEIVFDHGFLRGKEDGSLDLTKMRKPELSDLVAYMKWDAMVSAAEILRPDLVDATRAYRNFLQASGTPMIVDYEKFIREDRAGKVVLESTIEDTIAAALELSDTTAKSEFTMQTGAVLVGSVKPPNGRYPYPGTENWQKTIGAHVIWIEGRVKVKADSKKRHFTVDMIVRIEDRFNFNPLAHDAATGIADAENGRFEITGLGKEFDSSAIFKRRLTFEAGLDPVPDTRKPPEGKQVSTPR